MAQQTLDDIVLCRVGFDFHVGGFWMKNSYDNLSLLEPHRARDIVLACD